MTREEEIRKVVGEDLTGDGVKEKGEAAAHDLLQSCE